MIYQFDKAERPIREQVERNSTKYDTVIEFSILNGKYVIATDSDRDIYTINEGLIVLSEGVYPPFQLEYKDNIYDIEIIPTDDFYGKHTPDRIKIRQDNRELGTRKILREEDDDGNRVITGVITVKRSPNNSNKGRRNFDDSNMKKDALDVSIAFFSKETEAIQEYLDKKITREDFEDGAVKRFNDASDKEKKEWCKEGKRKGSD